MSDSASVISDWVEREFSIKVLGRTLDHLGRQTYKRRDVAIAELVANCWDANASYVNITVPGAEDYDPAVDQYVIEDDGVGMDESTVQEQYLVVGRNRRLDPNAPTATRPIMGRKGIGKLAGFGLGTRMEVTTWQENACTVLVLDSERLQTGDGNTADIAIEGRVGPIPDGMQASHGTRLVLTGLKHSTPLDLMELNAAIGRRFSRRVQGEMKITINGEPVKPPTYDIDYQIPDDGSEIEHTLSDGNVVRYRFSFAEKPIPWRDMRGFTILVHEKTAQAPPFFFNVEATASGQHGTKYLAGEIFADYLDDGPESESDVVSIDRQDIEWDDERSASLLLWGQEITRKALRDYASRKGEKVKAKILEDPDLIERIERLDEPSKRALLKHLGELGQSDADPEKIPLLADALVRAYEYKHFHDIVSQIDAAGEDPEQLLVLLDHLQEWKVLESRAILEIVRGRIQIIDKFHAMIVNDIPETAPAVERDNLHDLIARYPWLINPDWQVLEEERTITSTLREWGQKDHPPEEGDIRYDFLAMSDERRLVVIEIKRSGHAVTLGELQRLERYKDHLAKAAGDKEVYMLMICGDTIGIHETTLKAWRNREDGDIVTWGNIHQKTSGYYEHYRAVLEGDVTSRHFDNKRREVAQTRGVIERGTIYRGPAVRREGLGPQDLTIVEKAARSSKRRRKQPKRKSIANGGTSSVTDPSE